MAIVNGVVVGLVTAVDVGQVKLHFPWLDEKHETDWVRISTIMSGGGAGSFFMPNVQDEVLVAFQHGDTRFPFVVGFMWNGQDPPPATDVRDRILKSKNGHMVRFLDSTPVAGSKGALVIEDAHGNRISMSDGKIVIQSQLIIELQAPQIYLQSLDLDPDSDGPPQTAYKRRVLPNTNAI
jgi:uncharacterized protein involved in type VI secretion and phage assembly